MKTAILNEDIHSNFKKGDKDKFYGKKGDVVTVIAAHHPAVIVESKKGERFTVHVDKVTFTMDK